MEVETQFEPIHEVIKCIDQLYWIDAVMGLNNLIDS